MKLGWLYPVGDWNPQLLRELKGRLKPRNLIISAAISLLGQFVLYMSYVVQIPQLRADGSLPMSDKYCTGGSEYSYYHKCLADAAGNLLVDWQKWSLDLFLALSLIGIFGLLVAGTYLLINDLAQEERRGTLNFIRLSPQSAQSILLGKILGVPILLYLIAISAVPLHLWSGLAAGIPVGRIFSFDGILGLSCLFFYSLSLLFGLVSSALGGFQAWLGSGTVLGFLWIAAIKPVINNSLDWISIFSPVLILQYLIAATGIESTNSFSYLNIEQLHWFFLPVGLGMVGLGSALILNYSLWTYWCWQALNRRFHNPSKTIFSKRQSYLIVAGVEVTIIGFAFSENYNRLLEDNFGILLLYNFLLFLGLVVALTPQKQALQDWARYRKQRQRKNLLSSSLVRDLIWGEKSPVIVTIALNLAIASTMLVPWIFTQLDGRDWLPALTNLAISASLILVYAAIAQLVVFMRTQKQGLWIIGALAALVILPPVILGLLAIEPSQAPLLWLFTAFPYAAIKYTSISSTFLALLGQFSVLALCTLQISRQVKIAGESASKALLAGTK
ncbi:hypothetical protein [Aliterella atlantica]|uniref:Uncharacterized protein n=1 Tax=Aliterella atlantica CENA595 TaxID=1618023 RepID=A0A0D8ZUM6_9CYAN|nr:hypothetical protein [Aliterella atlantica]KJH72425.1 hypothetical protein UH38_06525 [Aliterella atlantica CENA595]